MEGTPVTALIPGLEKLGLSSDLAHPFAEKSLRNLQWMPRTVGIWKGVGGRVNSQCSGALICCPLFPSPLSFSKRGTCCE